MVPRASEVRFDSIKKIVTSSSGSLGTIQAWRKSLKEERKIQVIGAR